MSHTVARSAWRSVVEIMNGASPCIREEATGFNDGTTQTARDLPLASRFSGVCISHLAGEVSSWTSSAVGEAH